MPPISNVTRTPSGSYLATLDYSEPAPDLNAIEYGQAALRVNMSGASVKKLQTLLNKAGANLAVDGKFGPKTLAALKAFQESNGLTVDGVAGAQTFNTLESSFEPIRRRPSGPLFPVETPANAPPPPDGAAGQYERLALQKHGQDFVNRVHQIANRIGARPEWMFAVMQNESGMRTDAVNPNGGATGLIQFMPATARGLGTTTSELRGMSAMRQLDYVERYFAPYAGKIHSGADLYLATFYPAAMGKGDDYVLGGHNGTSGAVARANPIFNLNHDAVITAGEFRQYYQRRFPALGPG